QAEGLTITWLQDEEPLKEAGPTLTRDPKKLTAESSFKCNISNRVSFEISQTVKKTCPVPEQPATKLLFGFDFWTMVGILAGGGGLVLLLIIVTIVLCTRARRRRYNQLKAEGRGELEMAWSNQQQQQQQQQYQPARHGDPGKSLAL
uniref:Ig-like domain-containing protein n=1 Tax=Myripristis murdjan TaxID=586833 RepID=A0A667XE36_9TELE